LHRQQRVFHLVLEQDKTIQTDHLLLQMQVAKKNDPNRYGNFTREVFEKWHGETKSTEKGKEDDPFESFYLVPIQDGTLVAVDAISFIGSLTQPSTGGPNASTSGFDVVSNSPVTLKWSDTKKGVFDVSYEGYGQWTGVENVKTGGSPALSHNEISYTLKPNPVAKIFQDQKLNQGIMDIFTRENITDIAQQVVQDIGILETSNNENKMALKTRTYTNKEGKKVTETNAGWLQWRGTRLKHLQEYSNENGYSLNDSLGNTEFLMEELKKGEKYSPGQKYDDLLKAMQGGDNPETGVPYTYAELYAKFEEGYIRSDRPKAKLSANNIRKKLKVIPQVKPTDKKLVPPGPVPSVSEEETDPTVGRLY